MLFYVIPPDVETIEAATAREAARLYAARNGITGGSVTLAPAVKTFEVSQTITISADELPAG